MGFDIKKNKNPCKRIKGVGLVCEFDTLKQARMKAGIIQRETGFRPTPFSVTKKRKRRKFIVVKAKGLININR